MPDGSLTANLETAVHLAKDSLDFGPLDRLVDRLRQDAPSAPTTDNAAPATDATPAAATTSDVTAATTTATNK